MSYPNTERHDGLLPDALPDRPLPLFTAQRLALLPTARHYLTHLGLNGSRSLEAHQQAIAVLCKDTALAEAILGEIDRLTHEETKQVVEQGKIFCDCLVVGTGPAGVTLTARMRQLLPNTHLLMVDERDYRGGQFADEGYNYRLNTLRRGPTLGFPGELEDPNNLGSGAFLQLTDITDDEEYSLRKKLSTCLQINGFVASPALVGVKVYSIEITGETDEPYRVHALDKATGKNVMISPRVVVLARGRGKPKLGIDVSVPDTTETISQRKNNIYVSEAFNSYIDTLSAQELFQEIQRGFVFVGAGDTTNTALDAILSKLLMTFLPKEINTLRIDVYGAKYTNALDFEPSVRIPRYNRLIPYIGTLIHPHKEKVHGLVVAPNNTVGVITATSFGIYRTVAIMTGYHNIPVEQMINRTNGEEVKLVDMLGNGELDNELIAQQINREQIFSVGVDVQEKFPGQPPVFSKSIVRMTPRILQTAEYIADTLSRT